MSDLARGGDLAVLLQRLESIEGKVDAICATLSQSPPTRAPGSELRPEVLTYAAAAAALSISKGKLKLMLKAGDISRCRVGRSWGIPREEIERIANARESAAPRPRTSGRRPRAIRHNGRTEADAVRAGMRAAGGG